MDVKQLKELEMWFTKFGEKLKVLKWIVGGDRKLLANDDGTWELDMALVDEDIGPWFMLLQSKPFNRSIGEWTSN